jgi:indolepyruvate ferredoxin oxidoreductase beta subunit
MNDAREATGYRPLAILIAALGGEGGGVLCEWLVNAATRAGFPVQGTSIPGVAQRTGATTYYVEIFPVSDRELAGRQPVLGLTPVPGRVDLVVVSEPLEAARLAQAGLIDPLRTVVISSNERALTTLEKMGMGDARRDAALLESTVRALSRRYVALPMQSLARSSKTLTSAVMFGALTGAGLLPFDASVCEDQVRNAGRGAKASLAGFALGIGAVKAGLAGVVAITLDSAGPPTIPPIPSWCSALAAGYPQALRPILEIAFTRLDQYQGRQYVSLFRTRVDAILALEKRLDPEFVHEFALTRESARFLALWMCFEDVIRVADLKSRASRFARIRAEALAGPHTLVRVVDYFKPRLEEAASLLPGALASRLMSRPKRARSGLALTVRSNGVIGLVALRTLAALRPLRPATARYALEQRRIDTWLDALHGRATRGWEVTMEMALCGRLVKGYGETNQRAHANLERIIATFGAAAPRATLLDAGALALAIREAREAALADPDGRTLDQSIAPHGTAPRPPVIKPIVFTRSGKLS